MDPDLYIGPAAAPKPCVLKGADREVRGWRTLFRLDRLNTPNHPFPDVRIFAGVDGVTLVFFDTRVHTYRFGSSEVAWARFERAVREMLP